MTHINKLLVNRNLLTLILLYSIAQFADNKIQFLIITINNNPKCFPNIRLSCTYRTYPVVSKIKSFTYVNP